MLTNEVIEVALFTLFDMIQLRFVNHYNSNTNYYYCNTFRPAPKAMPHIGLLCEDVLLIGVELVRAVYELPLPSAEIKLND